MASQTGDATLREAVAVFDDEEEMRKAIFELESAGFDRADVSILPPMEAVRRKIGHELYRVEDAEDDPKMPRAVPVGPAAIGAAQGALIGGPIYVGAMVMTISSLIAGKAFSSIVMSGLFGASVGLIIGVLLAIIVKQRHNDHVKDHLDHGGLVLWVHIRDKEHEVRAEKILNSYKEHARDIHLHGELVTPAT
jgi:hypothetical protein